MEELSQFMSLVSAESSKVQKIKEEKEKRLAPKIDVNKSLGDFFAIISEAKSISPIIEAPKASGNHDLFKDKTYLQVTIPEPKDDLENELVKTKNATLGRSDKVIQSVKDHDKHSWFAIEQYLKDNNLEYDEGKCESLVLQSKPTITYFKDLYNVERPFEIDNTIDTLQLIKAAKECGLGRISAGFHYPMDYTAGNILAEKMYPLMNREMEEAARIPRKPGQKAGSDKHSDLYTDENPKGTIHGLGFKDVETAKASVSKIENSGKTHAHKIQAAIAMEQRAKVMGKKAEAAVYRSFIEKMKKKTKEMNKEDYTHYPTQVDPKKDKSDGWIVGDPTQPIIFDGGDTKDILDKANKEVERERQVVQPSYVSEEANTQRIDVLKTFFNRLDKFEETINQRELAQKMKQYMPEQKEQNELTQLKEQFNHFRKLVTHQMSTIGGGGAVNLLDLDDIDTSSLGNGKFLVYNSTSGKLEFTDQVDGN